MASTESGLSLEELSQRLRDAGFEGAPPETNQTNAASARVAWSWRGAGVAGVAAACIQAAMVAIQSHSGALPPELAALPGGLGKAAEGLGPALMAYGLWAGGRDAASTLFFAHFGLKILGMTSPLAYALGGGLASLGGDYVLQLLIGHGEGDMFAHALTGCAAGFLFRMLAGVRRTATT